MKGFRKYICVAIGAIISAYGAKAIITQEITVGRRMPDGGWFMQGTPAIIGGTLILAFGLFSMWLFFKLKE